MIVFADKYTSQFGGGSQYAYYHEEDESTFHLVDTARVQKPPYQRGRFRQMRGMRGRAQQQRHQQSQMQSLRGGAKLRMLVLSFSGLVKNKSKLYFIKH
jgi:translation initiation factor 3 subunit D